MKKNNRQVYNIKLQNYFLKKMETAIHLQDCVGMSTEADLHRSVKSMPAPPGSFTGHRDNGDNFPLL